MLMLLMTRAGFAPWVLWSSAVPKMPSGPALMTEIAPAALMEFGLMFLLKTTENWALPLVVVRAAPGAGLTEVIVGGEVSTTAVVSALFLM